MIVNAALWVALFFNLGLPMLAWLQVSFLLFCGYGAAQWALVRVRIGFNPRVRSDVVGSVLALGVFAYSVYAYWHMPGYTGSLRWALELGSVVSAIAAIWMEAFRYRLNWGAWTISNCFSWPLFWHTGLWGPFLRRLRLPGDQRPRLLPLVGGRAQAPGTGGRRGGAGIGVGG